MNKNLNNNVEKKMSQLPSWLWTTSNLLPPIYRQIWRGVQENRPAYPGSGGASEILVDTNKVFPLLLTSQLPTEVLGYIWSLANHKFAGQLTEQELYVVLALVAIAQASYTFNSLDVLHLIPSPPVPSLNLTSIEGKSAPPPKPQPPSPSFDTDEFSEFQSAAPVAAIPSIPMLDSRQGSAIGSRLANHNLGVKKIGEKPKKMNPRQSRSPNSKDLVPDGLDLFPKCSLKTQSKVVILKDTAIRNSEPIREPESNYIEKLPSPPAVPEQNALGFPVPRDKEVKTEPEKLDLMSVTPAVEDRYSALRILVEEPKTEEIAESNATDDFGDFVSALEPEFDSKPAQEPIDFFSSFEEFKEPVFETQTENNLIRTISDSFSNIRIENNVDPIPAGEKFDFTNDSEKVVQKEDSISVNSIELGNGSLGCLPRSGSVPSLDLKCFLTNSQDDDHQVENMHQLIYWEWKQYMESCVLLLQVAANIFGSITSEDVLNEVVSSAQGYNFLCNLAEVAAVCRRVNFSHKELDINIMGFDDLLMDIDRTWAEMEPFYSNIPIVTELPVCPLHRGDTTTCSLCLTVIMSGRIVHNDNSYHVTCANLWLNCINSNLPVLSYPLPSISGAQLTNSHV